jgi:hypothetical protein
MGQVLDVDDDRWNLLLLQHVSQGHKATISEYEPVVGGDANRLE